ncbi:MAG: hypothetical protein JW866_07275, partial [Ignavibacteriales bacterium]|nr:hypothetical protein [Ignavibacteriales bacterium]
MEKQYNFNFLDLLVLIVKHKILILIICFLTAVISYLYLRLFVDDQFDASALVIPADDQGIGGLGGMLKGLSDLPFGLGGSSGGEAIGMYNTIIGSRTTLEEIIEKFDLINVYKIDKSEKGYLEGAIKTLSECIKTDETEDGAYTITIRDKDPQRAADMTNYLIELLNRRIIELKTQKSKNDREFLEERLADVKLNLKNAEDSMRIFQEQSGMLNAENQVKGIFDVYTTLETELITKQIQYSIMENIYEENSPFLIKAKTELQEYEK